MIRLLTAITVLLLAGCSTLSTQRLVDGVALTVRSYDRASGAYVLELRNSTSRPILHLGTYRTFHTIRSYAPEPFPRPPEGMALMIHDTKLAAGASATLSGTCTAAGACSRPGTYVAVRVCWFTDAWTCEAYSPIWSATPLNGD